MHITYCSKHCMPSLLTQTEKCSKPITAHACQSLSVQIDTHACVITVMCVLTQIIYGLTCVDIAKELTSH